MTITDDLLPTLERATISYVDGKIRLTFDGHLPQAAYDELRRVGFQRWPKQQLFAATYTPHREDAVIALYPDVLFESEADLDTQRDHTQERAERFQSYATQAAATSDALAARPVARWDQLGALVAASDKAHYWQARAQATLKHQERRERPDVIYRRLQKLETDKRKAERTLHHPRSAPAARATALRWITFYDHRLAFERALYEASGGIVAEKSDVQLEVGGAIVYWGGIAEILKVNKKTVTVKTTHTWTCNVPLDDIKEILSQAQWHERNPEAAQKPILTFVPGGAIEIESRGTCLRYEIVSAQRGRVTVKEGKGTRTFKQIAVKRTLSPDEWQVLQAATPT